MLGKLKVGGRSKSKAFDLPGFVFGFFLLTLTLIYLLHWASWGRRDLCGAFCGGCL